ncbi:MAG: HD domain-containing phosphohydrolase [Pseudomonadota bacterium]
MSKDQEVFRGTRPGEIPMTRTSLSIPSTQSQVIDLVGRANRVNIILDVAKAMGSARSLDELLDMIADASRRVASAERCSLFIHDREAGELWTKVAHGVEAELIRLPVGKGIAGHVARTRAPVVIPDAYADSRFNPEVDKQTGYRTRNILCVPMLDNEGAVTGVIQVLNKKDEQNFSDEDQELLLALGGQAAVSVENAILHQDIEKLFESFIKASVYAIEARDPTTSGHSERVAGLTVGIARNVERESTGPYVGIVFGEDALRELRYAALLHDFGKVGVREHVLIKANKLYPHEFDIVSQRFDFVRRSLELEALQRKFDLVKEHGLSAVADDVLQIDAECELALKRIDEFFDVVVSSNRPTVLSEGSFERLQELAAYSFRDFKGTSRPLLGPEEVMTLSIPRGSLNDDERREIESHVTYTFRFLSRIPWTRDLKNVPNIAYAHHEKLNGRGYPRSLPPDQIPVQARIMTIADIYDALTASDRPYKRAVPRDKALDILHDEAKHGAIDHDLLRIFIEAEVYKLV